MSQSTPPQTTILLSNYELISQNRHSSSGLQYSPSFISTVKDRQSRHKISERERRGRLLAALADLQRRLPSEREQNLQHGKCKAATVEAAIAYISQLEKQIEQLRQNVREGEN